MDQKQESFLKPVQMAFMVFAVRELAGILARMVWAILPENMGNAGSSGLMVTGITAFLMIPVFLLMYKKGRRQGRRSRAASAWILLIPFGICAALGLNQLMNLLHLTQLPGSYESARQVLFSGTRLVSLLILGFLTPVAEELMFRGLILEYLKPVTGIRAAAAGSALLFGIYHGNIVQGIYAFLIGLLLAFVYEWFGSLLAPVLFHCAANIFVYFAADIRILGQDVGIIVSCVAGIAGAACIFQYYRSKT